MADNQLLNNDGGDNDVDDDDILFLMEDIGLGGDDVFVYTGGGSEVVPRDVKRVRIAENVDTIPEWTFNYCQQLIEVEGNNKIKKIEERTFYECTSLRRVTKMTGVIEIEAYAFMNCHALSVVDMAKLEIIGGAAFYRCNSLRIFSLPSIRRVGACAFAKCPQLTEVELSKYLETIGFEAFCDCPRLRRIFIPLKVNLLEVEENRHGAFHNCGDLSQVDLIGGIHTTVSSLLLDSWRNEMKDEIDRINQVLPNTPTNDDDDKTEAIRQWMRSVLQRMEHFTGEHYALLKEDMTLLEFALWKANLPNNVDAAARFDARVTCGANIIIPHVLSFLNDDDIFPLLNVCCASCGIAEVDKLNSSSTSNMGGNNNATDSIGQLLVTILETAVIVIIVGFFFFCFFDSLNCAQAITLAWATMLPWATWALLNPSSTSNMGGNNNATDLMSTRSMFRAAGAYIRQLLVTILATTVRVIIVSFFFFSFFDSLNCAQAITSLGLLGLLRSSSSITLTLFGGEFKDGIPQGRGRSKLADGSVQEFEYKDGKWQIYQ